MVNLNISDHPRHEKFRQEKSRYLAENHAYFYDVNNFIFLLRKGESPARYGYDMPLNGYIYSLQRGCTAETLILIQAKY